MGARNGALHSPDSPITACHLILAGRKTPKLELGRPRRAIAFELNRARSIETVGVCNDFDRSIAGVWLDSGSDHQVGPDSTSSPVVRPLHATAGRGDCNFHFQTLESRIGGLEKAVEGVVWGADGISGRDRDVNVMEEFSEAVVRMVPERADPVKIEAALSRRV